MIRLRLLSIGTFIDNNMHLLSPPKSPKIEAPKPLADQTQSDMFLARRKLLKAINARRGTLSSLSTETGSSNSTLG